MHHMQVLQRVYTRLVGIGSLLAVPYSIWYASSYGIDLEVLFKTMYIVIALFALYWGFFSTDRLCAYFSFWHGLTFSLIGLIGFLFTGLLGMPTFHQPEALIHTFIGVLGLGVGMFEV